MMSGSGARYANKDESFVFWNKGNTAFITEGAAGRGDLFGLRHQIARAGRISLVSAKLSARRALPQPAPLNSCRWNKAFSLGACIRPGEGLRFQDWHAAPRR